MKCVLLLSVLFLSSRFRIWAEWKLQKPCHMFSVYFFIHSVYYLLKEPCSFVHSCWNVYVSINPIFYSLSWLMILLRFKLLNLHVYCTQWIQLTDSITQLHDNSGFFPSYFNEYILCWSLKTGVIEMLW